MAEVSLAVGCVPQKMLSALALLLLSPPLGVGSKQCPPDCLCYGSSDWVDCHAKGLTQVPQGLSHSTWYLDLRDNKMAKLPPLSFNHLWSLRILVLSNAGLQVLQNKAFCHLYFLEKLDLSGNELRRLPADFSECLSALRELRLAGNALERLDAPSLDGLESLERLDLGRNRVRTVAPGALRGLARLRHLRLHGNRLATLPDGALATLLSLEVLLLGNNSVAEISGEALGSLRALSLLGLEDNRLERLPFAAFLSLRTPGTRLRLAGNPWSCDCDLHHAFGKLRSVRRLAVDDYANVTCHGPPSLAGAALADVDGRLCLAETVTVLVITVTVLVTVAAAVVMAEHNRKKGRDSESEADFQEK